jgi:hypothetical protein
MLWYLVCFVAGAIAGGAAVGWTSLGASVVTRLKGKPKA